MNDAFYAFYLRIVAAAAVYVLLVSVGIYAATRRSDLVRRYFGVHLVALVLGALTDVALVKILLPRGVSIPPVYMNGIFLAPIAFFIGFSVYLTHRATLTAWDILIPISPVVAWGCLVVFGWQRGMGDFDVLGAWFVAAGCGGVDLAAAYGPPSLTKRPLAFKLAGYLFLLAAVYLILPRATA